MTKRPTCAVAVMLIVGLLATGCTTLQRLPSSVVGTPPSFATVNPGDRLRLITRDGRVHDLRVLTVDPATIRATDNAQYQRIDVLTIERRNWDRRTNIALGISAGVITVLAILLERGLCVCTQ